MAILLVTTLGCTTSSLTPGSKCNHSLISQTWETGSKFTYEQCWCKEENRYIIVWSQPWNSIINSIVRVSLLCLDATPLFLTDGRRKKLGRVRARRKLKMHSLKQSLGKMKEVQSCLCTSCQVLWQHGWGGGGVHGFSSKAGSYCLQQQILSQLNNCGQCDFSNFASLCCSCTEPAK